jgi:UDP-N-acetylglucosamine acyltransferase
MPCSQFPRIHPTAVISAEAEIAEDVTIGPYVVVEGRVRIGTGCVIRPYVHLCGPLSMGCRNTVFTGAVLGEAPQHIKYQNEPTSLQIGDENIFREQVTVHRGTTQSWTTRVGSQNFFMAHSHVGHDSQVGNRCILANGALVGGHCVVGDNVYLSGNSALHQFVRVGRLALLSGVSATTKDIPPFLIQQNIDNIVGVNVVGMRRAGLSNQQIEGIRRAYHILFRQSKIMSVALAQVEAELADVDVAMELVAFIRQSKRGINPARDRNMAA